VYARLAEALRYPSADLHRAVESGAFIAELRGVAAGLPYSLEIPGELSAASLSVEAMQQAFIAVFDVGGEWGAPCSLYEGEYGGGRLKVLEEALRYYHHFGLRLSQERGRRDRPDHAATELEFLHALTFQEAALLNEGKAIRAYRDAQRDFLRVHLGDLLGQVAASVAPRGVPFYSALVAFGDRFCQAELAYLASV
jgi:DMSO reductase family type II enzyme chaperone